MPVLRNGLCQCVIKPISCRNTVHFSTRQSVFHSTLKPVSQTDTENTAVRNSQKQFMKTKKRNCDTQNVSKSQQNHLSDVNLKFNTHNLLSDTSRNMFNHHEKAQRSRYIMTSYYTPNRYYPASSPPLTCNPDQKGNRCVPYLPVHAAYPHHAQLSARRHATLFYNPLFAYIAQNV